MTKSNGDLVPPGDGAPESALTKAVRSAVTCAVQCTSCADAGVEEVMSLPQHLRDGPEVGSVCEALAWLATRQSGTNEAVIKGMLEACATACERRVQFCAGFEHPHCSQSVQSAEDCARDCRVALDGF
ncbi:MAG TPA: four-helix bundle copper-binding protein [Allosphingosinicella sp.]|jgi:hypothetical protein